jgi:hypothetical protein
MLSWLEALLPGTRLVFVHPQANEQRRYLWQAITQEGASYVLFRSAVAGVTNIQAQISAVVQSEFYPPTLVLDACDHVTPEDWCNFLLWAVQAHPHTRFIFFGRVVPFAVLRHEALRPLTQVYPVSDTMMYRDYVRFEGDYLLEARALGRGRVRFNGVPMFEDEMSLPRALVFFLADRGVATRDEIFKMFWARATTKEATNVFHVTKRKLNETFGVDITAYQDGFYRFADGVTLDYDVRHFAQQAQEADVLPPAMREARLRALLTVYKGDFLAGETAYWIVERRQHVRELYADVLLSLAEACEAQGKSEEGKLLRWRAYHP